MLSTAQKGRHGRGQATWLFQGLRPVKRTAAVRDIMAGLTLAAMNVPQALGYTKIAGTPVVTGLYTLLLPLLVFAALGSSRYLVVAADSATAAILAGSLSEMAATASPHYVALAGLVALLTAGFLLLARLLKLGFLADFLSQTVLVGFLTGVGVQVGIAVLGEMLGVPVESHRTVEQLAEVARGLPHVHGLTLGLSLSVVAVILVCRRFTPRLPGPLFAVVAALVAGEAFDFSARGIPVIGPVAGGLPALGLPAVRWSEVVAVLPVAGSCFLMIVAQSAATARAYASRHRDTLDENADLVGLAAANAAAALSGTFVVNGSPTQTAMVERSGGSSQLAHLATAAVVGLVLLFLTGPLQQLPRCVLGAIVFTIAVGLVDLRGLRDIQRESPGEFHLALITAAVVVLVGVEQGILLAMGLSLLRHVRHSYRPHTAVLIEQSGVWRPAPAAPGVLSAPGVVVFQFGADLFYANAGRFVADIRALVESAPATLRWLIVDAGAITSVDYSAARELRQWLDDLSRAGLGLLIVHAPASLVADLRRHRLADIIGADHVFDTLREALAAIGAQRVHVAPSAPAAGQTVAAPSRRRPRGTSLAFAGLLLSAALIAPRGVAAQPEETPAADATVVISSSASASTLGLSLVEGVLHDGGRKYLLAVYGAQPAGEATGRVYHLNTARDIAGIYTPGGGGLRNDRGVTIVFDPPLNVPSGKLRIDLSSRVYPKASTGQRGTVD